MYRYAHYVQLNINNKNELFCNFSSKKWIRVVHLRKASDPIILKKTTTLELFSNCDEYRMVEILLRNTLQELGDYKILQNPTNEKGSKLTSGYVPDLPFNLFKEAHSEFLKQYKEQEGYV